MLFAENGKVWCSFLWYFITVKVAVKYQIGSVNLIYKVKTGTFENLHHSINQSISRKSMHELNVIVFISYFKSNNCPWILFKLFVIFIISNGQNSLLVKSKLEKRIIIHFSNSNIVNFERILIFVGTLIMSEFFMFFYTYIRFYWE